jgi:hypothetical protein
MELSTRIQLRRQLEILEEYDRKNAVNRLSLWGYWMEFLAGGGLIGQLVVVQVSNRPNWLGWTFLTLGLALIVHSVYLLFRSAIDKRLSAILRGLLSIDETLPAEVATQVKRRSRARRNDRKKR